MVKLTSEYLSTKSSGILLKKPKAQSNSEYLKKKTHLRLHDQHIDDICDFSICKTVTVLYLHNNCIKEIKCLDHAIHLTHLYLQNNKIIKIENLGCLKNLCKLYLGFNEISVVENLEELEFLEELHIEKQRLPEGEELHFDPRTIGALSYLLRVIDVSGCRLRSLAGLAPLRALERLRAAGNPLQESVSLAAAFGAGAWPRLRELDVRGSPAARERRHWARTVGFAPASLLTLDGREVPEAQRTFMRGMHACQPRDLTLDPEPLLHAMAPDIGELALRLPRAVRRAVSRSLLAEAAAAAPAFAAGGASLPVPLRAVLGPPPPGAFPPWQTPEGRQALEGGGDGGFLAGGDAMEAADANADWLPASAADVSVAGSRHALEERPRAKVPRPFWRQRAPARRLRNPPARASASCPLRLPP